MQLYSKNYLSSKHRYELGSGVRHERAGYYWEVEHRREYDNIRIESGVVTLFI